MITVHIEGGVIWKFCSIKCYIKAKITRLIDKYGKKNSLEVSWADVGSRHSFLFEKFAIDMLKTTRNQTKSVELLRCGFSVVNNIIHTAN